MDRAARIAERIDTLRQLWERERAEARAQAAEERQNHSLADRVRRGSAIGSLTLADIDAAPGGRTLLWLTPASRTDLERARIGPGDPVRLWRHEPDEEEAVHAVVARRTREKLAVVIEGELPESLEEGRLRLDRESPEATFDRADRAMTSLLALPAKDPRGALVNVLFDDTEPEFDPLTEAVPLDASLNPPQRAAVDRAMAARTLSLILGPPGTGKTQTLAEVVRRAVARGERVLVTAASNLAVDNLTERLATLGVDALRVGHPARVTDAVQAATLDARLEKSERWKLAKTWMREAAALRHKTRQRAKRGALSHRERREGYREAKALVRQAREQMELAREAIVARHAVVCATASGADTRTLRGVAFDRVVLDEATQAVDPVALCALLRAPKATLAGDPHQLPPTVLQRGSALDLRRALGTTFFERLHAQHPSSVTMLEVQHRMHAELMAFPSAHTYDGRLRAHPSVAAHRLEQLDGISPDPRDLGVFVYLDTAGKGWSEAHSDDHPSLENPGQADRVADETRRLIARGLDPRDVAVITPYAAQAQRLKEALEAELDAGLEVGTVDGFQGREKEAIVVDLVRSNETGELGFLSDVRRLNVAITRARRFLMVVGDTATLGRHPFHDALIQHAEQAGAYLSVWSAH